jgi:hypothetical protein
MSAATCQAQIGTGSSVSWASAEGGITFNLADSATSTTPVAIPTTTGTNFSWIKNLVISVTVAGTTTLSNRTVKMSTSTSTGLALWWKSVAVGSYAQAASGNRPSSSGSNGATPTGYTSMTTTAQQYDGASVASSSTGPNGGMAVCVLGVDFSYVGGAGVAISLPNIILSYDEA